MKPERWQQLDKLFQSALERKPEERVAFLDDACAGDEELRRQIQALLLAHEQAGSFIEGPALQLEAQALADAQGSRVVKSVVGETISRYRVVEPLGAGGMGEVYLAQDTILGRRVALKILPAPYTNDADRLRRFEQEARTASALNHPNIVTIYEVGHIDSTHFIATEYLEGATLRAHLATTKLTTSEALDIAVQVASALSAAHTKGIVHRDIKPDNIMVLRTSYALHRENSVKVLDFGIAKLTEPQITDAEALTKPLINTSQGVVLGTVSYMSPEQSRGNPVDARTDIWSLGAVLYEMLMGTLPFSAETAEDMRAAILKDKLLPLSADIPERLKWIVEKALRKDREDRYQTARELFSDLRELQKQEFASATLREHAVSPRVGVGPSVDIPTGSAPPGTKEIVTPPTSSAEYLIDEMKRHKLGVLAALSALLVVAVGGGYLLYRLYRSPANRQVEQRQSSMKITRLTDSGNVTAAAISPDGNYVIYARANEDKQSLWLRQINPFSEREIVSPVAAFIRGPTFSNDGKVIYYTASDRQNVFNRAVLYHVPLLGGTPRKLLSDVSSPISFSPDGRRFAFVSANLGSSGSTLIVANADGTGAQGLASLDDNKFFQDSGPAWSPDGRLIACGGGVDPTGIHNTVMAVPAEGGDPKPMTSFEGWTGLVERVAWIGDGSGLIVVAAPNVISGAQIWHLSYPSGEVKRITNDLSNYSIDSLALNKDSDTLVTVQQNRVSNFWLMSPNEDASHAKQVTQGSPGGGITWTLDGKMVFPRRSGEVTNLWIMDKDGTNQRQLTASAESANFEANPAFSRDGRYLAFNSARAGISHIWRTDADGSNPKQLTYGNFEDYSPQFTADGRWILFASWQSGKLATWKVPVEGGEPVQLARETSPWPTVSPDGKFFACGYRDDNPNSQWKLAIYPIEGGPPVKLFDITSTVSIGGFSWMRDGRSLIYVDTAHGVSNIWSQPIEGGPPTQLTNFKSDLIFKFALSPDGREIVLARGTETRDVVLIKDFR